MNLSQPRPTCASWRLPILHSSDSQLLSQYSAVTTTWQRPWCSASHDSFVDVANASVLLHDGPSFSGSVTVNSRPVVLHGDWWTRPRRVKRCDRHIDGPAAVFNTWRLSSFAHVMIDFLPALTVVLARRSNPRLVLPRTPLLQAVLRATVPATASKAYWVEAGTWTCVNGVLTVFMPGDSNPYSWHRMRHVQQLRMMMLSSSKLLAQQPGLILYYYRKSARHGRRIPRAHDMDIRSEIRTSMRTTRRREILKIYTGMRGRHQMPFLEQMQIFKNASMVIGPHGGGLANILWVNLHGTSTGRPKVLEFICSTQSVQVQPNGGCPWTNTFYWLWAGAQWLDYHHLSFASNSSRRATYVDLFELRSSLHKLLSRGFSASLLE